MFLSMRSRAGEVKEETQMQQTNVNTVLPKQTGSSGVIAIDNNNPLNIRVTSDDWKGLAEPRSKKGFFNFVAPEYGFRAAKQIILNAYAKRGIKTVAQVIETWAPRNENDTDRYISDVCSMSGLRPSTIVSNSNIKNLLSHMAKIESGKYWSSEIIDRGMQL